MAEVAAVESFQAAQVDKSDTAMAAMQSDSVCDGYQFSHETHMRPPAIMAIPTGSRETNRLDCITPKPTIRQVTTQKNPAIP